MTSLWHVPTVVLTLLMTFAQGPATLGDLSRREMLRRQLTPPSKTVVSNMNLPEPPPPMIAGDPTIVSQEPPSSATAGAAGDASKPADPPKDEKWWRERMAKARQALAKDEAALPAAEAKAASLTTDVVNMDDPARQRQLRQQLLAMLTEVERIKAQVEADRKLIADIQAEARKAGIPPGWIR
jgi:hypothetical protein